MFGAIDGDDAEYGGDVAVFLAGQHSGDGVIPRSMASAGRRLGCMVRVRNAGRWRWPDGVSGVGLRPPNSCAVPARRVCVTSLNVRAG
jgi:hypothetical protein